MTKPAPLVGITLRFTEKAARSRPPGKPYGFAVPANAPMPVAGDKFTLVIGEQSVTFRVLEREFEYLPDTATVHLTLGTLDER